MRGLFLRNYLSNVTKDKLPDVGTKYEGEGGDVNDAIDFLLQGKKTVRNMFVCLIVFHFTPFFVFHFTPFSHTSTG
jgi:hypothetical protein